MTDKRKKSHFHFCWSMLEKTIKLNRKVYDVNNSLKRYVTIQVCICCFVLCYLPKLKKGVALKKYTENLH